MYDVVTLGECMVLLQPEMPVPIEQAESLRLDIAGAESNLAIGLSRLGHRVHFISRIGDDPFGRRIRATLAAEGVDPSGLRVDSQAPTGVYFKEWLPDGARRIFYYRRASAASRLAPTDLQPEVFSGATFVHLTGITPALSQSCAATVQQAIDLAHQARALVSFDPNYRSQLWGSAAAREVLLPLLAQADILLMSHEDAWMLFESTDEASILERALARGPRIVVLKRGERGARALTQETALEVPAEAVETVIDPVGAGDGFNAGFLAGWLRGETLEAALRLGAKIGAAAVAHAGDYTGYPRL
jgi:2-dehydro-3-deoxygluconokinase